MRATPFFGGLAMSFVVEKLIEKKVKFSQVIISSYLNISFIMILICKNVLFVCRVYRQRSTAEY